jgi:hypothetical protein
MERAGRRSLYACFIIRLFSEGECGLVDKPLPEKELVRW